MVIGLDRSANAPDWIGVDLDEAEDVTEECIHISCIGRLIIFRDYGPIGCRLNVQKWMAWGDIGDR